MIQNTIAIICDCDQTLAPDTTNFLLEENGINSDNFWKEINILVSKGWDPPLAWMTKILCMIKNDKIEQDTNKKLSLLGNKIKPYSGVTEFIPEIKDTINKNSDFIEAGINIESYIISSGFEDLIKGSVLSRHFTDIFAGTYNENPETGKMSK